MQYFGSKQIHDHKIINKSYESNDLCITQGPLGIQRQRNSHGHTGGTSRSSAQEK
jgi:hypothetical protein